MRRGEMGPVMYMVLAVIALLAIAILIVKISGRSWGVIDFIKGALP